MSDIHYLFTMFMSNHLPLSNQFKNSISTAQKWSNSFLQLNNLIRNISSSIKILPIDKLIDRQESVLTNKVINGTYLPVLADLLNHGDVRHHIKLRNNGDLRLYRYMQPHILDSLFDTEPSTYS